MKYPSSRNGFATYNMAGMRQDLRKRAYQSRGHYSGLEGGHCIDNKYRNERIAKAQIEEGRTGAAGTECENIEVGREPDKKHLVEPFIHSLLIRNWRDPAAY